MKMPAWIKTAINTLASKYGGVKGYLLKKLLEYGGQYLLKEFKKLSILVQEYFEKRKAKKEDAKAKNDLVKESQKTEGMTDDELSKAQESAWSRFINKLKP